MESSMQSGFITTIFYERRSNSRLNSRTSAFFLVNIHKPQETVKMGISGAQFNHIAVLQDKIAPNHLPVEVCASPDTGSLEVTSDILVD